MNEKISNIKLGKIKLVKSAATLLVWNNDSMLNLTLVVTYKDISIFKYLLKL